MEHMRSCSIRKPCEDEKHNRDIGTIIKTKNNDCIK